MNNIHELLEPCKTDYLFLLVGTNPLPNYVAARLLARPKGKIYLLHSRTTGDIAQNLTHVLQLHLPEAAIIPREVPESGSERINAKLQEILGKLPTDTSVGLNYTGGTKAMSVHVYRSIESRFPNTVFSYLDSRSLSLQIDGRGGRLSHNIPVLHVCGIRFDQLIALHSRTTEFKDKQPQKFSKLLEGVLKLNSRAPEEWRKWCNTNLRREDRPDKFKSNSNLKKVSIPLDASQVSTMFADTECIGTLENIPVPPDWKAEHLAEWLDGKWLEHYVLICLQELTVECDLHDVLMSVGVKKPGVKNFEFDLTAMRGYQLFAISCTTDPDRPLNKHKLIEAYIRARQMGGDEAHTALVSCYRDPDNPDDPDELRREINEDWSAEGHIQVFGREHLPALKQHLREWFNATVQKKE